MRCSLTDQSELEKRSSSGTEIENNDSVKYFERDTEKDRSVEILES